MDVQKYTVKIEKGLQLLVLLLVVSLSYQSAQLTLMSISPLPMGKGFGLVRSGQSSQEPLPNIQQMLAWNIFGEVGKIPTVKEVSNIEAPETKLSLILQGVSVGRSDGSSSAIISESKGASGELYWVGDSVLGKAILVSVHDDRIVLKQNGRLETLRFSEDFKSSGLSKNTPISSSNREASHSDMLRSYRSRKQDKNSLAREMGSALNDVNKGNFESFDSLLDQYGGSLEDNITSAGKSAGLEVTEGGVKVSSKAQKMWMNKVGLKPGDVVKSVNSYPVLTLKGDRSAIDSVIKSCVARIEVQRGQNTFVVTYPFCK